MFDSLTGCRCGFTIFAVGLDDEGEAWHFTDGMDTASVDRLADGLCPTVAAQYQRVADKGVVLLSWTCQYTGVKAIAVQHSTDSIYNYKIIGYVKKLDKGIPGHMWTGIRIRGRTITG